jgi:hypothetical protein
MTLFFRWLYGDRAQRPANRYENVTVAPLVETPQTLTRYVAPAKDQRIYGTGFTLRPPLEIGLMSRTHGEGSDERPLTGRPLRLQRVASRNRQPRAWGLRVEKRGPQCFPPRSRCLLWVIFDATQVYRTGLVYLNDRKCGAHSDTSESRHRRSLPA